MAGARLGSEHRRQTAATGRPVADGRGRDAARLLVPGSEDSRLDAGPDRPDESRRAVYPCRPRRRRSIHRADAGATRRARGDARRELRVPESAIRQAQRGGHHARTRGPRGQGAAGAARDPGRDGCHPADGVRERGLVDARAGRCPRHRDRRARRTRRRPAAADSAVAQRIIACRHAGGRRRRRASGDRLPNPGAIAAARRAGRQYAARLDGILDIDDCGARCGRPHRDHPGRRTLARHQPAIHHGDDPHGRRWHARRPPRRRSGRRADGVGSAPRRSRRSAHPERRQPAGDRSGRQRAGARHR